ncbi:MAG TPA: NADH:ubiquinone reductase (Na(+)-transporting) subunit F [Caldithrix abyssi]|uniref:Na(+)-translocating NADH-quinone reductase subunit F n=1 Tax=Caldithrix abyssi TaxID=187145 RepID=A0A7V5RNG1_CALAY|nr:NADH:ubiquinone reductase (Na(+)-transporting) subunit F [Caldithrix abyssi]
MPAIGILALSVGVFGVTIMLLVGALTYAEAKLVQKGKVKLLINGDEEKSPEVEAGSNLLATLSNNGIFLPSACGGQGTCAMCKCKVLEGGGDVLPTEESQLSRGEVKEHTRLACQVKVKQDMKIEIPEEIFNIQKFECTVRSNHNVATFIKELVLELPKGQHLNFKAGGYIQIYIPPYSLSFKEFDIEEEYHPDWDRFKIWDLKASNDEEIFRAYSMANHPAEGDIVMLNVRIATPPPGTDFPPGVSSSYIFNLKPGDKVTVSGPYGEFFIKDTDREMVYIGGGAGMAPMRSHIFHLFHTLKTTRKVTFFYGARSKREMFYDEDFKKIEEQFPNFKYVVALSDPQPEDNWTGPTGFIHQAVEETYLSKHEAPEEIEYYLCGPPMMLSAVQNMLYNLGVEKEMIAFDEF